MVLLDTHVLIWWLFDADRLSATARDWIGRSETAFVSAVSLYEIDVKRRDGRARAQDGFLRRMPADMPATLPMLGFQLLDVTSRIAWRAANLDLPHGDPWDRMLVATAQEMDLALVTSDTKLRVQAAETAVW